MTSADRGGNVSWYTTPASNATSVLRWTLADQNFMPFRGYSSMFQRVPPPYVPTRLGHQRTTPSPVALVLCTELPRDLFCREFPGALTAAAFWLVR